jgi:hypothetical protein
MGIMLHYFRNNQHFYQPQRPAAPVVLPLDRSKCDPGHLCGAAQLSLHQRPRPGLQTHRGLLSFCLLTLFGLFTLFLKIRQGKVRVSTSFRVNGWAVYLVALLLCTFNWDRVITRYNLTAEYSGNLDTEFLLDMSDKNLPDLIQYHEVWFWSR